MSSFITERIHINSTDWVPIEYSIYKEYTLYGVTTIAKKTTPETTATNIWPPLLSLTFAATTSSTEQHHRTMAPSSQRAMGFSPIWAILGLFMLFSNVALAANAVIGIDFGTEYITAALVKPGIPLDIVLTKDSRRKELSAVAFKPIKGAEPGSFPERLYGSDAVSLSARFPGDVYPNLRAILGLTVDDARVKEYSERYPGLVFDGEATRNTAQFKSPAFPQSEEPWMVEEILAMELQSIQKNAELMAGKGSSINSVVITVPPYFDAEEKRAIELAADLAGLRVLSLISDGLAVGLNYATSRTFEVGKPETHIVFDMGAGSSKATILKFQGKTVKNTVLKGNKTVQEIEVLGSGWDRTLGGDALNTLIVNDMVEKFVESKAAKKLSIEAATVKKHARATAMLWKSAEKLRQVLSANTESSANFEGLFNDIDFRYKLTRSDFEKFTKQHIGRVYPVIEMALKRANMELSDIDSIILTGGATRTPFVQSELKKMAGADKLRSNVNADEAAVFGAGFKGASLSPSFRVKEIRTHEAAQYAVGMKWTNINLKAQKQRLYSPQGHIGVEKVVSFQNLEDFDIHFYQQVDKQGNGLFDQERGLSKLQTKNLTATVAELKEKHGCKGADIITRFGVRLSLVDGEVEITKAAVQCEVDNDEKKGVVDGVKGIFGFGKKDEHQDIFADSIIVSDADAETESSTSTKSSKSSKSSSSSSSPSAAASQNASEPEKPKKKMITIPISFNLSKEGYPALPADVLAKKKQRLAAFDNSDKQRLLREESLNQLEAFTYRVRDKLEDAVFIAASTVAERTALGKLAEEASEWLYGEGADATREALRTKLNELKKLVTPIEDKMLEASKRPAQIKLLRDSLDSATSVIETVKKNIKDNEEAVKSWSSAQEASASSTTSSSVASAKTDADDLEIVDEKVEFESTTTADPVPMPTYAVSDEDLQPIVNKLEEITKWLEEKLEAQNKLSEVDEPVLLVKDMADKANEVSKMSVELIMKGMKQEIPKPKKTSTKRKVKTKAPKKSKTSVSEAAEEATPEPSAEERVKDEL